MMIDQVSVDKRLYGMITLANERLKKHLDVMMIIDGTEGTGKTSLGIGYCYLISKLCGREFTVDNILFDLEELVSFASTTEKKIIMWDEAALGGMRMDWSNDMQKRLIMLLNVCRKKQHIIIFIIPRFKKLKEDIIERSLGLIHCYSPDEIHNGVFAYYRRERLFNMYTKWKSSKTALYSKYYDFSGNFPDYYKYNLIDRNVYENKKDLAIASLAPKPKEKQDIAKNKADDLLMKVSLMPDAFGLTSTQIAAYLGMPLRRFQEFRAKAKAVMTLSRPSINLSLENQKNFTKKELEPNKKMAIANTL